VRLATVALEACILLLVVGAVAAQDRMPPIPKEKMTEAQKKSFEEVTSGPRAGGGAEGPFVPLLRSPELMSRLQKTGEYLRFHNTIGPKLTEFVILLTARQWTQQYEYDVHQVNGAKAGIKQETINAITEGRRPTGMEPDEEIVYDFCSELRQNQSVSDATYARAVSKFGEQGVIDTTALVGYYTTLAMIMNVARSPLPDGKKAPLASFPH
jgi:4-carboxymuconolactone decarboxylase